MTESLLVLVSSIASLLMVDPFYSGGLTKATLAKGIIFVFGFGSLAFHFLGRAVTAPERFRTAVGEALHDWWPLIVLATIIICGSIYARWVNDIKETFLNMGMGMLFLPMMAVAIRSSDRPMALMKWLAAIYVLTIVSILAVLLSGGHTFHESIFIVMPIAVYLVCSRQFSWWRTLIALALVGSCLYSFKNTTFLLVLATLLACSAVWLFRASRGANPIAVVLAMLLIVPLTGLAIAGLAYGWWSNRDLLPSGNVEYRTEMYGIAWRMFRDSPLWGNVFADSSVVYFALYKVDLGTQYLPTHSDVLDLLAHGGVIAIVLWLMVLWRMARIGRDIVVRLVRRPADVDLRPWQWLGVLLMIQVGALMTYVINPVLISPVFAYWIWGAAGVMWALHREMTAPMAPVSATRRFVTRRMMA